MALNAWRCNPCGLNFPPKREFDDCPVCGTNTKATSSFTPMEYAEAKKYLRHRDFELWCEENGRREEDGPRPSKVILPPGHTPFDGHIAWLLVEECERLSGDGVELHVFVSGLVSRTA